MLNDLQLRLIVAQRFRKLPPIITLGVLMKLLGGIKIDNDTFIRWTEFNDYTALNELFQGYEIFTTAPISYLDAYNILGKT